MPKTGDLIASEAGGNQLRHDHREPFIAGIAFAINHMTSLNSDEAYSMISLREGA